MREPLFTPGNTAAGRHFVEGDPQSVEQVRLAAAWHRATNLAIESAFRYGMDFPVGAVALAGDEIVGRGHANDNRFGVASLHAEIMAMMDTKFDVMGGRPDTLVTTLEPCNRCQDQLARVPGLVRVAFGVERGELVRRGLVNPNREDVFERANRIGFPFRVIQITDNELQKINFAILDHASRDTTTGVVAMDTTGLSEALIALNAEDSLE